MLSAISAKIPPVLRSRLGLALFASAGVLVSLGATHFLREAERTSLIREFEHRQNLRHDFLKQSFNEYENSLFALRLVAENNADFSPAEFERTAAEIHARSPGVQCVQWVPIVPSAALPAFVGRARDLVSADFQVRQRDASGQMVPLAPSSVESSGAEHAVITYLYPLAGNESALGYDIFTAPTAPDLRRARETFAISLSRPLRLVQGYEGVVLTCLARRDDSSEGPPASGSGYVQIVLRLSLVLQRLWNQSPGNAADFALYDVSEETPQALYTQLASRQVREAKPVAYANFVTPDTLAREFKIGGRFLRACYRPREGWLSPRHGSASQIVLFCSLALTVLGCAYLRLLLRRAERIRHEVLIRTQELSESRALLDTVIRHSPSAIWVKDAELRFQLVNAEFCRTYGLSSEEIIGQTDALLFPPDQAADVVSMDREILRTGQSRFFEATYPIFGQARTYLVGKFPLRKPDGAIHAVAAIATDITDRRRAEADRAAMERRLLETQKLESLGVLAGGIAHDFNNLLTGILGHASLCRAQMRPDSPHQHSLLQIENGARRAAELCQQMLAYSGRGHFSVEPAEIGALIRDTVPLLRLSISKHAQLHFDLAQRLPLVVADLTQLRQIIMNLVMNASDALGDRAGTITLRTSVVSADASLFAACVHAPELPAGKYVCLEVTDTGSGMPPETLARIFDPFFTTKFTGRGLGLAAVLGIVRGHKGALRVTTAPGAGTTFFLFLPASASTQTGGTNAPFAPSANAAPVANLSLLLVDDEESVRETASLLLRTVGYRVDCAANGAEALRLFLSDPRRYHAALIDLTMPGLSGGELMRELRAHRSDLPVLLMSGYSESDAADLLSAPLTTFLPKPFTLAVLKSKIASLLDPAKPQ